MSFGKTAADFTAPVLSEHRTSSRAPHTLAHTDPLEELDRRLTSTKGTRRTLNQSLLSAG